MGNVFREMLPVGVDGDGIVKLHLAGFLEAGAEGVAFASVSGVGHDGDVCSFAVLLQQGCGVVGAAVIHHHDMLNDRADPFDDVGQRFAVVVCGNDGAVFHFKEYLRDILA